MGKANTEVPSGQERKIFIFSAYASKYHRTASLRASGLRGCHRRAFVIVCPQRS